MPMQYLNNPLDAKTPIITVIACSAPESGEMGPRFSILTNGKEGWKDEIPLAYLPRFLNLATHPEARLISNKVEEGIASVFAKEVAKTDGKYHFTDNVAEEVRIMAAKHPAPSENAETYDYDRVNKFCDVLQAMTTKQQKESEHADSVKQQQEVYTAIHQLFKGLNEQVPVVDKDMFHAVIVGKYENGFEGFLKDLKERLPKDHPVQKKQFRETLAEFLAEVPSVHYGEHVDITTKNGFIITSPSEVRREDKQNVSLMGETFTPSNVVLAKPDEIGFGTSIPAAAIIPDVETPEEKTRRTMPRAAPDEMDVDTSVLQSVSDLIKFGIRSLMGVEKRKAITAAPAQDATHLPQASHSMAVDDASERKNDEIEPTSKRPKSMATASSAAPVQDGTFIAKDLAHFMALYSTRKYENIAIYRVPTNDMRTFTRMLAEKPAAMHMLIGGHVKALLTEGSSQGHLMQH